MINSASKISREVVPSVSVSNFAMPGNYLRTQSFVDKDGTRIERLAGSYVIGELTYSSTDTYYFPVYSYAYADQLAGIPISPYSLFRSGSRQIDICNHYARWAPIEMELTFVPSGTSNISKGFITGFTNDGTMAHSITSILHPIDWNEAFDVEPSVIQSVSRPFVLPLSTYLDHKQWYYFDVDDDTDAGYRQSYAGAILVNYSDASQLINGTSYGYFVLRYTFDLCDPLPFQNIAFAGLSGQEKLDKRRDLLQKRIRRKKVTRSGEVKVSPSPERDGEDKSAELLVMAESALPYAASRPEPTPRLAPSIRERISEGLGPRPGAPVSSVSPLVRSGSRS